MKVEEYRNRHNPPSPSPNLPRLSLSLDWVRLPSSGSECVVRGATCCGFPFVPANARFELLLDHHLLLPPDSNRRICKEYLDGEPLRKDLEITSSSQVDERSEAV